MDVFSELLNGDSPWIILSALLLLGIWKAVKFVGLKLIGPEGYVERFSKNQEELHSKLADVSTLICGQITNQSTLLKEVLKKTTLIKPNDEDIVELLYAKNPVAIMYIAQNGEILKANEQACTFFGRLEHDLEGQLFSELTGPDYRSQSEHELRKIMMGEQASFAVDTSFLLPNGETKNATLTVMRYPSRGEILHFIAYVFWS